MPPPPDPPVRVRPEPPDPATVHSLLRSLPAWFGIEEAIVDYVAAAARLPTYLARAADNTPVGVLLVKEHFPTSAEVFLMAVAPTRHRTGVGRALLCAAEEQLVAQGVRVLQVKTLGPSRPDPKYAVTRMFYAACGFQPLEELHGIWGDNPCLVLVKTLA